MRLSFQAFPVGKPTDIEQYSHTIETEIPKSTWVEEILPALNYKSVTLIELPRLEHEELAKAIEKLDNAWKSYSSGEMDDVLTNCRKALEDTGRYLKKCGYVRQERVFDEKKGKEITVDYPDWKKFYDSDSNGEIIGTINKKMFGFVARGTHSGSILEMNYAYFALLQTFSLIHCIISRFKMIEDNR